MLGKTLSGWSVGLGCIVAGLFVGCGAPVDNAGEEDTAATAEADHATTTQNQAFGQSYGIIFKSSSSGTQFVAPTVLFGPGQANDLVFSSRIGCTYSGSPPCLLTGFADSQDQGSISPASEFSYAQVQALDLLIDDAHITAGGVTTYATASCFPSSASTFFTSAIFNVIANGASLSASGNPNQIVYVPHSNVVLIFNQQKSLGIGTWPPPFLASGLSSPQAKLVNVALHIVDTSNYGHGDEVFVSAIDAECIDPPGHGHGDGDDGH